LADLTLQQESLQPTLTVAFRARRGTLHGGSCALRWQEREMQNIGIYFKNFRLRAPQKLFENIITSELSNGCAVSRPLRYERALVITHDNCTLDAASSTEVKDPVMTEALDTLCWAAAALVLFLQALARYSHARWLV
jgi:hypothetical protein